MLLAKVIGDVVSTVKEAVYEGKKLLWVQPLGLDLKPKGEPLITIDAIGAGAGEVVLVLQEGGGAQEMCGLTSPGPIGSAIVAIVDKVNQNQTREATP